MNAEMFNELVRNRRSTFPDQFDPENKVPDEIVKQIVQNATWAPNHGRTEPWHFTVFTGQGLKKLADFQGEVYKAEQGENYKESVFIKFSTQPLKASHVIALGMKRSTTKNIPEIEDIEAVACAVQNMYLSVTAYGLGGYWTTGGVTYREQAKSFFGLGEQDKLLGFFMIGQVAVPSTSSTRAPLEEKMTWIDF